MFIALTRGFLESSDNRIALKITEIENAWVCNLEQLLELGNYFKGQVIIQHINFDVQIYHQM